MATDGTIAEVVSHRALSTLILGLWLGAAILADIAVTQNFQTVDRFLPTVHRTEERSLLRRNAAEENAWIFENWERAELVVGAVLVFLLRSEKKWMPILALTMFLIVAAQHLFLTGQINDLGRLIDDLPASDPRVGHFWIMHGFYSGLDLLKLAVGFSLAVGLMKQTKELNG